MNLGGINPLEWTVKWHPHQRGKVIAFVIFTLSFYRIWTFPWPPNPLQGREPPGCTPSRRGKGVPRPSYAFWMQLELCYLESWTLVLEGTITTLGLLLRYEIETQSSLNYFGWKWLTKVSQEWWQFWATGMPFHPQLRAGSHGSFLKRWNISNIEKYRK